MIFAEATRSGAIEEDERAILSGVMRLGDRAVRELMTPRTEVDWLDVGARARRTFAKPIARSPHSRCCRWPRRRSDRVLGVVKTRDVAGGVCRRPARCGLERLTKKAAVVPDQLDAMDALRILQSSGLGYGHGARRIRPSLWDRHLGRPARPRWPALSPATRTRARNPTWSSARDGSLLISGRDGVPTRWPSACTLDLPDDREFATAAGYVLYMLKHLPTEGEHFTDQGWRFEVVDMDGRKIDKLLVSEAVSP